MKIKSLLIVLFGVLFCGTIISQNLPEIQPRKGVKPNMENRSKSSLNVTPLSSGATVQQMVETLIGDGVAYSNVVYTGATVASGLFSGGEAAGIGIEEGIILSSGAAENAIGPNDTPGASQNNGLPGDPDLDALGYSTNDASILEFDFIPESDQLSFSFVMGSEEYTEYLNFADVFAFFLDGENVAVIPGTTTPISIGTVNNLTNSEYYISNEANPPPFDIQCDGFTVVFDIFATVTPFATHTIKMAIADHIDTALDSWIFLEGGSFVGSNIPPVASGFPTEDPEIYLGDTYSLTVEFDSPEPNQITDAILNIPPGLTDFNYTVTPGKVCEIYMEVLATPSNLGTHLIEIIATDNGSPVKTTTEYLELKIKSINDQIIPLIEGWSMISSYLQPSTPAMEDIFSTLQIPGSMVIVVSLNGVYWPLANANTIGNWNVDHGYKLKMNEADVLTINGETLDNQSITYPAGFHYIAVATNVESDIDQVFDDPINDVYVIFDLNTGQVYWPGGELFTLTTLVPGVGYMAMFNTEVTAEYPNYSTKQNMVYSQPVATPVGPWPYSRTGSFSLISVTHDALANFEDLAFVGAFDASEKCIGAAEVNPKQNFLLTLFGDDVTTSIKDGAMENEFIHFKGYNEITHEAIDLIPEYNQLMDVHSSNFIENGLSQIINFKAAATGMHDTNPTMVAGFYPNPANDMVTIKLVGHQTGEMIIAEFFNTNGEMMKQISFSGHMAKTKINDMAPGVYVVKISSANATIVEKLIIQ